MVPAGAGERLSAIRQLYFALRARAQLLEVLAILLIPAAAHANMAQSRSFVASGAEQSPIVVAEQRPSTEETPVDQRQRKLSEFAKKTLQQNPDRCQAFATIFERAVEASGPRDALEDLKAVLIGKDLARRDRGPYYVGRFEGSEGFKPELADRSPQIEHAFAAIYIGATYPPASTELVSAWTEFVRPESGGRKVEWEDVRLYMVGGDLGQRISRFNYKQVPEVIRRTMCKSEKDKKP